MKILHTVEFYDPSVGGSQEVVKQLSEHMVKLGHEVTVATTKLPERKNRTINNVKIAEFDISGNAVRGYEGSDVERYKKFLIDGSFDVVMNYAAQQWATDLFFEVIDRVKGRKILVPCGYSGLYLPEYEDYFKRLPTILKKYDASVYLADNYRDIQFARQNDVGEIYVIPNGADEAEFGSIDPAEVDRFKQVYGISDLMVLTVGNHTGAKGHNETIKAFKKSGIGPATLVIIGRRYHTGCYKACRWQAFWNNLTTRNKIQLLEVPRGETVRALKSADIFLFLSNIEASPLVLFEAAAAGVPFISSEAGNAGQIADWTKGGLIAKSDQVQESGNVAPSIEDASKLLKMLATDQAKRRSLGATGRTAWQKRFTWAKITKQYLKLYEGK